MPAGKNSPRLAESLHADFCVPTQLSAARRRLAEHGDGCGRPERFRFALRRKKKTADSMKKPAVLRLLLLARRSRAAEFRLRGASSTRMLRWRSCCRAP